MPGGRTCVDPEMDPIVRYHGSQGRGHYRLLHGKDSDSHKKVQRDPLKHSGHWCLLLAMSPGTSGTGALHISGHHVHDTYVWHTVMASLQGPHQVEWNAVLQTWIDKPG